jgi:peptidyl-prolyl cis-trans isomerase SurA
MTPAEQAPRSKDQRFFKVEKLMEPGFKSLDEARGYVIADYQDYLEAQWVEGLREEYPVKVNQTVFDSLIKKEK